MGDCKPLVVNSILTMVAIVRLFAMVALSAWGQDDASTLLQIQRAVIQPQKEQPAPELVETEAGLENDDEWGRLGGWVKKAKNAASGHLKKAKNAVSGHVKKGKRKAKGHLNNAKNKGKKKFNKEKNKLKNRVNEEKDKLKKKAQALVETEEGLENDDEWGRLGGWVKKAKNAASGHLKKA